MTNITYQFSGKALGITTVISGLLFILLFLDVTTIQLFKPLDIYLYQHISLTGYPMLTLFMTTVTRVFDPLFILPSSFLFFLIINFKNKSYTIVTVVAWLTTLASVYGIKILIQRVRPTSLYSSLTTFSFPSAHSAVSGVFIASILLIYAGSKKTWTLKLGTIAAVIFFLLVAFSRIYLQVHWTSDVIAGLSLGAFWFCFWVIVIKLEFDVKSDSRNSK